MPLLFVATVGGSPEPVIHGLRKIARDLRVIFVVSEASVDSVPAILAAAAFAASACDRIQVPDEQDLNSCIECLRRELAPVVSAWLARGADYGLQVDITGGTKCMSGALAMISGNWPCVVSYVGGRERNKSGVGAVVSGTELVSSGPPAGLALGLAGIEEAISLANAGEWAAATLLLGQQGRAAGDPAAKRAMQSLAALTDGFGLWDRFEHERAMKRLQDAAKNRFDLGQFLTPGNVREIERALPGYVSQLGRLTGPAGDAGAHRLALIGDLLANAMRRREEGRFDDAVARLYRMVEAIAQYRLASHGIDDTSCVSAEALPAAVAHLAGAPLALQHSYEVLSAFGDPVGAAFWEQGLAADPARGVHSPLTARNLSILAHGWKPLGAEVASGLYERVAALGREVGIRAEEMVRFPRLVSLGRGV